MDAPFSPLQHLSRKLLVKIPTSLQCAITAFMCNPVTSSATNINLPPADMGIIIYLFTYNFSISFCVFLVYFYVE